MDEAAAAGKAVSIQVEKFNPAMRLYRRPGFKTKEGQKRLQPGALNRRGIGRYSVPVLIVSESTLFISRRFAGANRCPLRIPAGQPFACKRSGALREYRAVAVPVAQGPARHQEDFERAKLRMCDRINCLRDAEVLRA